MSTNPSANSANRRMVICISGMAGTGKSTMAKKLAAKYGLDYFSGGDALKELATEQGYDASKHGWWETPAGLKFLKQREKDTKFDEAVDRKLLTYAEEGNVLLDSWTMPWLLKNGFKIWLLASLEKRAKRVAKRDRITAKKAMQVLKEKENRTRVIYKKLYGFTLGEDFKPFDLILDTNHLNAKEVFQILCQVIDSMFLNKTQAH